jgi:hypothetical protein
MPRALWRYQAMAIVMGLGITYYTIAMAGGAIAVAGVGVWALYTRGMMDAAFDPVVLNRGLQWNQVSHLVTYESSSP